MRSLVDWRACARSHFAEESNSIFSESTSGGIQLTWAVGVASAASEIARTKAVQREKALMRLSLSAVNCAPEAIKRNSTREETRRRVATSRRDGTWPNMLLVRTS